MSTMSLIWRRRSGKFAGAPVRLAILRDREVAVRARQAREHDAVELLRQRVELHRAAMVRITLSGSILTIIGTTRARSASRRLKSAAPYRSFWKNWIAAAVPRVDREIGVRHAQPARLPVGESLQRSGEDRIVAALGVQPLHALELADERVLGLSPGPCADPESRRIGSNRRIAGRGVLGGGP